MASNHDSSGWADQVKADKELGGANYDATVKHVRTVMDKFAPEGAALRTMLNETGYGDHPELVRFVAAIGKAIANDGGISRPAGGGNSGAQKTAEQKLWPQSK